MLQIYKESNLIKYHNIYNDKGNSVTRIIDHLQAGPSIITELYCYQQWFFTILFLYQVLNSIFSNKIQYILFQFYSSDNFTGQIWHLVSYARSTFTHLLLTLYQVSSRDSFYLYQMKNLLKFHFVVSISQRTLFNHLEFLFPFDIFNIV